MTKRALIREREHEIERLKAMLAAAHSKNGIYLPEQEYQAMQRELQVRNVFILMCFSQKKKRETLMFFFLKKM